MARNIQLLVVPLSAWEPPHEAADLLRPASRRCSDQAGHDQEGVDVVIVAGDTCEGVLQAFEHLRAIVPMAIPIVMVMGNHEYYRRFVPIELALAKQHSSSFNIHVIENDSVVIGSSAKSRSAGRRSAVRLPARRCGPITRSSAPAMSPAS